MTLSQTKVVDYTVKWLKNKSWEIIFAHYPEGHHISPEYGMLKIIKRKFIDIIAKKGKTLFLIQCNTRFKPTYIEKLNKIKKEDIKEIDFDILLKGIAFHTEPSIKDQIMAFAQGFILIEVKGENVIKLFGKIPINYFDEGAI
jgi:hypothetical protein